MTAKLTAQAGTGGFRRTFVDRNRIAKITDRRFPLGATALARFRATRKHAGMQGVGSGTWAFAASLALVTFALDPTLAIFLGGIAIVFHLARTLPLIGRG